MEVFFPEPGIVFQAKQNQIIFTWKISIFNFLFHQKFSLKNTGSDYYFSFLRTINVLYNKLTTGFRINTDHPSKLNVRSWKKSVILWQPEPLNRNGSGRFGAVKSDSTHHFFGNACTKLGPLRFSQFSGYWLIFSVFCLMSFAFPFGRLLGVR